MTEDVDHSDVGPEFLEEIRTELESSADDIDRLTDRITEQAAVVERLETLVNQVFQVLPCAAVVVDPDGSIAAVSEEEGHPAVSQSLVGKRATSVLPRELSSAILAVAQAPEDSPGQRAARAEATPTTGRWVSVDNARVAPLPGGWVFAILDS
jgi:hypothetical protein